MKTNVLLPSSLADFECIGSSCPDSCCKGWAVPIDLTTYRKYRKRLRNDQLKHLEVKKDTGLVSSCKIRMHNGSCPFLDDQKLCTIFNEHGEPFLSDTCKTYPRLMLKINDVVEMSFSLSCPVVVDKVIMSRQPYEFNLEQREINVPFDTFAAHKSDTLYNNFWEVRDLLLDIAQTREYTIPARLMISGAFLRSITNNNEPGAITRVIAQYQGALKTEGSFERYFSNLKTSVTHLFAFYEQLFAFLNRIIVAEKSMPKDKHAYYDFISLMDSLEPTERFDAFINRYQSEFRKFEGNNQHVFENLLIHYIFHYRMPLHSGDSNCMEKYHVILLHFLILRMMGTFYMIANPEETLPFSTIVQRTAKLMDHTNAYETIHHFIRQMNKEELASIISVVLF